VVVWQAHPFYTVLGKDFSVLQSSMTLRLLQRGEVLTLEGEPCSHVYWVAEGRLRMVKTSIGGREQTLAELSKGEALNVVPALDGGTLPATALAATRASVFGMRKEEFVRILNVYPALAMFVLADLARKLRKQTELAADLALRSVGERLARLLVNEAATTEGVYTTQREIAARLGTVREVLARELARFESRGWVRLKRGAIEITNLAALRSLAEEGEV
jgi:CRP/FNR family transcriptional regulator, cyclic AMP receptor protein